jgi:CSLREA domain-containing protein
MLTVAFCDTAGRPCRPFEYAGTVLRMTTHALVKTSLAAGIGLATLWVVPSASATTFTVNRTSDTHDTNPGNGICRDSANRCSLRAAIEETNATPNSIHVIDLPTNTYSLTLGELVVSGNQIIRGVSMFSSVIQIPTNAGILQRPLRINTSGTVDIMSVGIRDGRPEGQSLNLGGGIYVESGVLRLYTSRVMNSVATAGGGIYVNANAGLQLTDSELSGNRTFLASSSGGVNWTGGGLVIATGGWATIWGSTIWGNEGQIGGGIYNSGYLEVSNSTISGNKSRSGGGGIFQLGDGSETWVRFSTITQNVCNTNPSVYSNRGGGLYLYSGGMHVGSSILAGNTDNRSSGQSDFSPDCGTLSNSIWSWGYDVIGNVGNGCALDGWTGDQTGTANSPLNAQLGILGSNGGLTLTHAPNASSPAIDSNWNTEWWFGCNDINSVDQRSFVRPTDGNGDSWAICDTGAVERASSSWP